jgi:hypothetical protein
MSPDLISGVVAFLLTLMVMSYLIGDNPAFRIAVHLFVGVAAGYVAAVAWWQVLWPDLILPLVNGPTGVRAALALPLLLSGMLLMKAWPSITRLGMPAMGVLVGAASAVAVGGALQGTLVPQVTATIDAFDTQGTVLPDVLLNGSLILAGAVSSLAYFHFSARLRGDGSIRRLGVVEILAAVGGIFIAITLGVLFAGVYSAALTALIERLHFLAAFVGLG